MLKFRYLTLQVEPTRACNLDCKICMRQNFEETTGFLSLDNFRRILDSGSFRFVGLHGWGEPLLNPQLFEMIKYAESRGVFTNLTTNGTLIQNKIDNIFNSGLREIAFGIYDREFLTQSLPQIEALEREKKRVRIKKPKTYFDITIYKDNIGQIAEWIKLASELGVNAVILHRLFNLYKVDPGVECLSDKEEEELFSEVNQLARVLKLELYLPPKHSSPCRYIKHCVFVTARGQLTPCVFLPEFYMGNALEHGVKEIMRSKTYTDFVRNMGKHPICSKCRW